MSDFVKVQKQKLVKCLTCPLCHDYFNVATTISECLHTFCKKCIYEKIEVEELDCCPVCETNLGGSPLEKLGYDHNLQNLRNKIFGPVTAEKSESSGSVPSAQLPASPKNLSLSSLEITEPNPNESLALEKQKDPNGESSEQNVIETNSENSNEEKTTAQLKRSKRLIEAAKKDLAANDDKSDTEETSGVKSVFLSDLIRDSKKAKAKAKAKAKRRGKTKSVDVVSKKDSNIGSQSVVKPKEKQGKQEALSLPASNNVGDSSSENIAKRIFNPIWFSLIALDNQEVGEPLPQISSHYLRVKDGTMTVSTIKKYIVKKLNLASEDEVELRLQDQPLISTTTLSDLVDQWIQMGPKSKIIEAIPGSSGKDIVMVLGYGPKTRLP